ncbi:MAG: coniferyl aldehyde dehydrogenase [Pseudomonadales bacterium]|jgi:coniferyl-aldehyde dehydrogenase|nr:coniferyl aldehyde dehydrogenase [Pseudomonadales bacterium]MDP6470059.1 coniferyl aldehyde dehydrogenase [Pseudomonadales bacterium]MDP6826962.1 coniferyl aldehyde dehydrogenase [Pseudomonadales bacterium]MDP6971057.1 coniferyl aldehyde dehydrogenase [Pseudomonadales bacterium]
MHETSREDMVALLERQREDYLREGVVSAATRHDRLERAASLLVDHQEKLVEAMRNDFGHRSDTQSLFTDIAGSIGPIRHAQKHLQKWMRPEKRKVGPFPLNLLGAKARIDYQPLGVVGVISPWNFPVNLTFSPLAGILSSGNRCMIKPSEFTPATSEVMAEIFPTCFDVTEIAVVTGGPQTGGDFSGLPFDHLLFTGATSIARHVMRAASENLVPVTLELGGKSPVVVGRSADMQKTTDALMAGKMMNAGQICLAPDYVFVPADDVDAFVDSTQKSVAKMFPTLIDNSDYTSVINRRHFDRINGYVEDARAKGAKVVEVNPADEDFRQQANNKIPPTLILDPTDDMQVMQDEIFGPVLPVKRYDSVDQAIDYINGRPRPLGLYYFGTDSGEEERVLHHTTSGGVTVNDVVMHVAQEDLPFGGVGPSGMGAYHGVDGFRTFSHAKSVFTQSKVNVAEMAGLRPPYGEKILKTIKQQIS